MQVCGEREPTVVAGSALDAAEHAGQRTISVERHVGVAGRDDVVNAVGGVEDASHRLVEFDAAPFDLGAGSRVVLADGHFHPEANLRRQVVCACGPDVGQLRFDCDVAAQRPRRAHPRQRGIDAIGATHAAVSDQRDAGLLQQLPHHRRDDRAAPVGSEGNSGAAQRVQVRAETRFPTRLSRHAQWVARIEAIADIEPTGCVAHGPRDAADGDCQVAVRRLGAARNSTDGGLQADHAGEARGNANAAATVAGGAQGDQPASNRSGRAAAATARRLAVLPRAVRGAMKGGARDVDSTEFAGVGEAHQHRAAVVAQPLDHGAGVAGDLVLQRHRRMSVGPALHVVEFLHPDGHTAKRLADIGRKRSGLGLLAWQIAERVERARLDGLVRGL